MDKDKNVYKIYQLSDVLVNKYGYTQIVLQEYRQLLPYETWLVNKDSNLYKIIRISFNSASAIEFDEKRINDYLSFYKKSFNVLNVGFLDIHINKEEYEKDLEIHDYINIDNNYCVGTSVEKLYPELLTCIHEVDDYDKEINSIIKRMQKTIRNRVKKLSILKRYPYLFTYIIIGICALNFILNIILQSIFNDSSSVLVILGADYKTFTLGLKQFYRLITYAFVHNDIFHILFNMSSLLIVGKYVEYRYGHLKFLLAIFLSIICGALTQGILSDNGVCVGISAGIYGLLVIYIFDMFKNEYVNIKSLIITITLNLFLNFLSTAAWMAHLGGAIAGLAIYYAFNDNKNIYRISLCIILVLSLFIKYVRISSINSLYGGTDLKIVNIINELGLKNYSNKLFIKLLKVYEKYGG